MSSRNILLLRICTVIGHWKRQYTCRLQQNNAIFFSTMLPSNFIICIIILVHRVIQGSRRPGWIMLVLKTVMPVAVVNIIML